METKSTSLDYAMRTAAIAGLSLSLPGCGAEVFDLLAAGFTILAGVCVIIATLKRMFCC